MGKEEAVIIFPPLSTADTAQKGVFPGFSVPSCPFFFHDSPGRVTLGVFGQEVRYSEDSVGYTPVA